MIFISYTEWATDEEKRLVKRNPLVKCPTCRGTKRAEKRCCCCDGYKEDKCDDCDDGKVTFDELTKEEREEYLTVELYEKAVLEDATLLASWLARDLNETLIVAGFHPWMDLWSRDKHLHLIPSRR